MIIYVAVKRTFCILVAWLLLLSVAVVFMAPGVNLEPTAMRALQAATLAMAALAATGALVTSVLRLSEQFALRRLIPRKFFGGGSPDPMAVFCTRLC